MLAKEATCGAYQGVEEVAQMIDLLILIDDEFVSHDITMFEDLVSYEYQINLHPMITKVFGFKIFKTFFVIF